ncbi:DMT family transporter [Pseudaquabacterium pictum]|uniref:Membrane protein n=1 Tax=Pseudaquabacterium pictum TaxID=2315236 RepID=A0A480APR0_9BURK|nr:DMT family transporter [Rubrivivax pictus]GCL62072.1 membrane protein [Rubrivivax pictus]
MTEPPGLAPDDRHRINRQGIGWMLLAMTAFMANDALVKAVGARVPAAQLIVVRGMVAISLICLVAWRMGVLGQVRSLLHRGVLGRAACEGAGTFLYLAALFNLPLANVTAINLSAPLFVALLAWLLLGEAVHRSRWAAIGGGFIGVLLVVQPQAGQFNQHAWLAVAATVLYSVRDLLTRSLPPAVPSILVTLATAGTVWALACAVLLVQGPVPMAGRDIGLLALAAVFLSTGYFAIIAATRQAELSVVAPFRYVGLLWALLLGWVVWGDVPNLLAWVGMVCLVAAGLAMVWQQRRR